MARNYYKRNFVDAVEILTPDLYLDDDLSVCGVQIKDSNELINSHIYSAEKVYATLGLSSIVGSNLFSSLGNINGFSQFFLKQNKQTEVTTQTFQDDILTPFGRKFSDFSTSTSFATYLSGTLLPAISLNSPTLQSDTSGLFGVNVDETTKYFLHQLGWLYLLNTNGPIYSASSIITSSIIKSFYNKRSTYKTNDGIKDYQEYLWKNYASFSAVDSRIIPPRFTSGAGTYTSGTQNLEKLKTLVDVVYSPLSIDKEDTLVETAFQNYISTSSILTSTEFAGPLTKFLKAMSYSMYDVNDQVEGLQNLLSVEECPAEFLPHLATLIGWTLYGKNEQSWRNQIRNAASLYKKKGTKQGLIDAFNTIIPQNPISTEESLTELYESYLPNLLYYALVTESPLFKTSRSYTAANAFQEGAEYIFGDLDFNVKAAVDTIIQATVAEFPDNFVLKNEPFRVTRLNNGKAWFGPIVEDDPDRLVTGYYDNSGIIVPTSPEYVIDILRDPAFVFNYRGKDHPIPPWDEEKFYEKTSVSVDLLNFLKSQLERFCVPTSMRNSFSEFVYSYTVSSQQDTDLYIDNGFLFFTESQQFAPNTEAILASYDEKDYDYLSLWNGKSSTFDFSVTGGQFTSEVFGAVSATHSVNDILQSLSIVDEMTPAKAIPKVKFSKGGAESLSGMDFVCPSVRVPFQEVQSTGVLANLETCGVYDRGTGFALGRDIYPSFDDSDSVVSHSQLPVFSEAQAQYGFSVNKSVVNTSATVLATSSIDRRTVRRRDFQLAMQKSGWFDRDGKNMPSFYNNNGSILEFVPLGYNASTGDYAPTTPENLSGVYGLLDCSTLASNKTFFGVDVSSTFPSRDNNPVAFSSCDQYVRRDTLPEATKLFFNLEEKKKYAIAEQIIKLNADELNVSANRWQNLVAQYANEISDEGYSKYYSPKLDIRNLTGEPHGVHYIYKIFNKYFSGLPHNYDYLPESFLNEYTKGGANILSHVYGPIYENSDFLTDGSAIDVSSQLISKSLENPYPINIALSSTQLAAIGLQTDTGGLTLLDTEQYSTKDIVSGVSFVDASTALTPTNEFLVLDLLKEGIYKGDDTYLLNHRNILLRSRSHGLPRVRYGLRTTSKANILIPEHDFELNINYLTGDDKLNKLGTTSLGVLIHTKVETTISGRSVMFVWTKNKEWEMVYIEDLQTANAREQILTKYSHLFSDPESELPPGGGGGACGESDVSVRVLNTVTKESYSQATIKFNTSNKPLPPIEYGTYYNSAFSDVYNGQRNQVHRADISSGIRTQNYFLEIFAIPTNYSSNKFVLLDSIDVIDKTLSKAAKAPYEACIPDLGSTGDPVELPTLYNTKGETIKAFPIQSVMGPGSFDPGGSVIPDMLQFSKNRHIGVTTQNDGGLGGTNGQYGSTVPGWGRWGAYPAWWTADIGGVTFTYSSPNELEWRMQRHGLALRKGATYGSSTLPYWTWWLNRPAPYTGCNFGTWTGCQWGYNVLGRDSGGYSLGLNQKIYYNPTGRTHRQALAGYFAHRGGLYENTDPLSPSYGETVGSWASFNKWADLCFGGQIPQKPDSSVVPSWDPGVPPFGGGPGMVPSGISNNYGPIGPLKAFSPGLGQSNKDFHHYGNSGHNIKNPLGYTLQDDNIGTWHSDNMDTINAYSFGSPTILCFISRRFRPENPQQLNQKDFFERQITDQEYVFGAYAWVNKWQVIDATYLATLPYPPYQDLGHTGVGLLGKEEDNFNKHRALPPYQATYYDIPTEDLVSGKNYTFTVYVAKCPFSQITQESWGYPNGSHGQTVGSNGVWKQNEEGACTSATINLQPIDTSSTYSRIVIDLDTGDFETQINGNGEAGTVEVITYATPDPVTWYKVQVTVEYNHLENDIFYGIEYPFFTNEFYRQGPPGYNAKHNYGLRAFVQGINTRADGLINSPDDPLSPIDIPGVMMVWGSTVTASKHVQWNREATQWGLPDLAGPVPPIAGGGNNTTLMSPESTQIVYTAYGIEQGFQTDGSEFDVETDQVLNVDANGEMTYNNVNTSSLDKITLVTPGDGTYKQWAYTSSLLYDLSGKRVTNTKIIIDSTESLMLYKDSVQHYPEVYQNRLQARHDNTRFAQGTNVNYCIRGTLPFAPRELLHLFRYFNYIGQTNKGSGLNTRVANVDSTGVHCASGGSRLSYRTHPDNFSIGTSGVTFHNFTNIDITN